MAFQTREIPKRLKQKKELNKFLQDVSLYAIFFTLLVVSIYLKDNTYTISRVNYAIKKMFIEPTADPAVDPAFALNKVTIDTDAVHAFTLLNSRILSFDLCLRFSVNRFVKRSSLFL